MEWEVMLFVLNFLLYFKGSLFLIVFLIYVIDEVVLYSDSSKNGNVLYL